MESNFIKILQQYPKNEILEKSKKIPDLSKDVVFNHYIYLLEFVNNIQKNNITDLIGLIHMCYGWMPTMYKKSNISLYSNKELINDLWQNVKEGSLDEKYLKTLKTISNNSIKGSSKLLHFCNPEMYAIYDTRVFNSIVGRKQSDTTVNNIDYFIYYIKTLREWSKDKDFISKIKNILI